MAGGSVSETLDNNPPLQPLAISLSPSSAYPSLSRSESFSRLNTKVPEFAPSPQPQSQQQQKIAIPQSPPGVVHVYPPYPVHPLLHLHHYPPQVPVRYHHKPPPQQRQHSQYYSAGADYKAASSKGGHHQQQQSHSNQNQDHHHHHHDHRSWIMPPPQVVNGDGKKIKRLHTVSDTGMEELQSRVVVAENLPEDHCYQNLMKIFSAIGSVTAIHTCQPQPTSIGASPASRLGKGDGMLYYNKLHAFVEYESVDLADKALNDEENWRSGLRVRLLRRRGKPVQARGKKGHDGEELGEEEDASTSENQPNSRHQIDEPFELSDGQVQGYMGDDNVNDREGGKKKGRGHGRGKGHGRGQYHQNNRGNHPGMPLASNQTTNVPSLLGEQPSGPRMPDGTRGFSMGRGRPVSVDSIPEVRPLGEIRSKSEY